MCNWLVDSLEVDRLFDDEDRCLVAFVDQFVIHSYVIVVIDDGLIIGLQAFILDLKFLDLFEVLLKLDVYVENLLNTFKVDTLPGLVPLVNCMTRLYRHRGVPFVRTQLLRLLRRCPF